MGGPADSPTGMLQLQRRPADSADHAFHASNVDGRHDAERAALEMTPAAEDGARSPLLTVKGSGGGNGGSSGSNGASQASATLASGGATQRSSTAQDLLKSSIAVGVWYTSNIGCVLPLYRAQHLSRTAQTETSAAQVVLPYLLSFRFQILSD